MRRPARPLVALLVGVLISGCGVSAPSLAQAKDPIAGTYLARGGGGALDNVNPLIKAFAKIHPNVVWQGLDDVGSDAGIKLVQTGDIDLSFISRDLKTPEVGTVATVPIGATGTGIAVNASNRVTAVTTFELGKIFNGDIVAWSTVGGDAIPIRVLVREAGSATRNALETLCYGGKAPTNGYAKGTIEVGSYDETVKSMNQLSGAVGMMSMSAAAFAEPSIHLLAIDGVPATRDTLLSGKYPMRRPLYLVYPSDPGKVKPAVQAFIDFVKGPAGQAVLAGV